MYTQAHTHKIHPEKPSSQTTLRLTHLRSSTFIHTTPTALDSCGSPNLVSMLGTEPPLMSSSHPKETPEMKLPMWPAGKDVTCQGKNCLSINILKLLFSKGS